MSKIGKLPVTIPAGVTITVDSGVVTVKGPKGELKQPVNNTVVVELKDGTLTVNPASETKEARSAHGLYRCLIQNMVTGVTSGFSKTLIITGVGYRAEVQGNLLVMNLGYSHPVIVPEIDGITIEVPNQTSVIISGSDKQKVGQFAAEVREKRPPEPYKGKGIKYADEHIQRKEGKAGKGSKK